MKKYTHRQAAYYYSALDGSPLTIAGLWDEWKDIETGEPVKSCTMIVTNANDLARKITRCIRNRVQAN
jgi:putative SOS response-associated peptidase YedK